MKRHRPAVGGLTVAGVVASVVIYLGLLTPLNVSDSLLARLFTTDKAAAYFALIVIGSHVSRCGLRVIRQIPGLRIWGAMLGFMAVSTALAPDLPDAVVAFARVVIYSLFGVAQILIFRQVGAIRLFWKLWAYVACGFVLLGLTSSSNWLSAVGTEKAEFVVQTVDSSSFYETYAITDATNRATVLWFAANNLAYIIMPALMYFLLELAVERWRLIATLCATGLFGLLVYGLVETASRGGTISTICGCVVLLISLTRIKRIRGKSRGLPALGVLAVGAVVIVVLAPGPAASLMSRFSSAAHSAVAFWQWGWKPGMDATLVGDTQGDDASRVVTAELAYENIVQRPLLGWGGAWGGAKPMGTYYGATGNHLGYLNILGRYGLIGFSLNTALLVVCVRRLFDAIKMFRRSDPDRLAMGYWLGAYLVAMLVTNLFRTITAVDLAPCLLGYYLAALCSRDAYGTSRLATQASQRQQLVKRR